VTLEAHPERGLLLLVGCWALAAHAAFAQIISSHWVFGEYQQFIWNDQHGLPQNSVSAAARTRDGYLWLEKTDWPAVCDTLVAR
jgi:hypothetical protein